MARMTSGCGCAATKASGDPHGMSISGLAGLRGARKRKSAKKTTKRKATKRKTAGTGAFCVITPRGASMGCNFKTKTSAQKMASRVKGKVVANTGSAPKKKARKKARKTRR